MFVFQCQLPPLGPTLCTRVAIVTVCSDKGVSKVIVIFDNIAQEKYVKNKLVYKHFISK